MDSRIASFQIERTYDASSGDRTQVLMIAENLHDEEWTARLRAGRTNEMDNLARVIGSRG